MKKIKKLLSLVLAMVMVLAMSGQAFAEGEAAGTITINGKEGQTYTVYRIFDLESYNATNQAYLYTVNGDDWKTFINGEEIKDIYVSVDAKGYVSWVKDANEETFAKLALDYAKENSLANQGTGTISKGQTSVSIDVDTLGYYLVDSSLGALCALDTTNPDATITEKNDVAANVKKVEEDSTNNYGEENDAEVDQVINFQSTITAQKGAENYVLYDKMADGLDFVSVTNVTLNGVAVPNSGNTNYEVKYPIEGETNYTFKVEFKPSFCENLKDNDTIVVTYTAKLNDKAVVGESGNENKSWLSYGDNNNTVESKTITKTWDVDVFKYGVVTENGEEKQVGLKDATFTLSKNLNGTDLINLTKTSAEGEPDVYRVDSDGTVTAITTGEAGTFTIEGLDSGDVYYLTETIAPAGYNKLDAPVQFKITSTGTVQVYDATTEAYGAASGAVNVLNSTGTLLPSTGGIGTTVFYAAGIILMAGAVFFVVRRKRA